MRGHKPGRTEAQTTGYFGSQCEGAVYHRGEARQQVHEAAGHVNKRYVIDTPVGMAVNLA